MASLSDAQTELNAAQSDLVALQADVDKKLVELNASAALLNAANQRLATAQLAACDAVSQLSPDTMTAISDVIASKQVVPMPEPALEAPQV